MTNPSTKPLLTDIEMENGLCAWIDALRVKEMDETSRQKLFEILSSFEPNFSTNVFQTSEMAFPDHATNSLLVGDALCITQSAAHAGSQLFVFHTALALSATLFAAGFPNRGVIVRGKYKASHPENGMPHIIGPGIIDAVKKEAALKAVGIAIDPEVLPYFTRLANRWAGNSIRWTKEEVFGHHFISSDVHMVHWKKYCDDHYTSHPYSAASKSIVDAESLWERRPE